MNRLIIMGSPRSTGRSAHLAEMLFEACIDECPEDELFLIPVSELNIEPCVGCGACRSMAPADVSDEPDDASALTDDLDSANEEDNEPASEDADDAPDYPYCPRFDDDMQDIYSLLPIADELIVVAPVYFSGAPAPLKALLDRLQPHFWAETRKGKKRPETLHVVGEGGDPHGFDPLISEVKSSTACAGFRLERVLDWVGKIDANGEIIDEAIEIPIASKQTLVSVADVDSAPAERPKLSFSANAADKSSHKGSGKGGNANAASRKGGGKGQGASGTDHKKGSKGGDAGKRASHSGKSSHGKPSRGNASSDKRGHGNANSNSSRRGNASSGKPGRGGSSRGGRRG